MSRKRLDLAVGNIQPAAVTNVVFVDESDLDISPEELEQALLTIRKAYFQVLTRQRQASAGINPPLDIYAAILLGRE